MTRTARLFVEMQVAMVVGAAVCFVLGGALRATELGSIYHPGTLLYFTGDVLFLAAPVAIWMLRRDAGWRRAAAVCAAMLSPVLATLGVGRALGEDYLAWLVDGMYPLMTLGTIGCLVLAPALFERDRRIAAP